MSTVLVTGFERYGTTPVNPAEKVARALNGETVGDARVVGIVVPSLYWKCIETVRSAIEEVRPRLVILLGEYAGRSMITVERVATNFNDATRYGLADNAGNAPQDEPTIAGGPVAYYATLPLRAMVKRMREAGIPADISDTAATLMCNHLMYGVLHHIAEKRLDTRAGWIHLPHLPEVAALLHNLGNPSMSMETSAAGVRAAIKAALDHPHDITDPIPSRIQI
jgi:pyroglutamyl-peptidase